MRYQKSCRQWQALLAVSHPEEDLSPSEYAALEKHVAECADCQAVRGEYRTMTTFLRAQVVVRPLPGTTPQRIRLRADLDLEEHIAASEKPIQQARKNREPSYSFTHSMTVSFSHVITVGLAFVCVIGIILASLYVFHFRRPFVNIAMSVPEPVPTLPAMTLPNSHYVAIAQQDAIAAGISPIYFVRQINELSGFNPSDVSPTGSEGIAQFEPGTAAGLGINPWDPIQALRAAAQLMASYSRMYGGDYAKALAAYYGGTGTVQYALNNCGDAHWLNCLPNETRQYIHAIMGI